MIIPEYHDPSTRELLCVIDRTERDRLRLSWLTVDRWQGLEIVLERRDEAGQWHPTVNRVVLRPGDVASAHDALGQVLERAAAAGRRRRTKPS